MQPKNPFISARDKLPICYQSLDANGLFLDVNAQWLKLLGYTRKEIVGASFTKVLTPKGKTDFKNNFLLFKRQGFISNVEFEMIKKNKERLWVSFNGLFEKDAQGNPSHTHCVFQDISQKKLAEQELREKIEELQQFHDIVIDRELHMIELKKQIKELKNELKNKK